MQEVVLDLHPVSHYNESRKEALFMEAAYEDLEVANDEKNKDR